MESNSLKFLFFSNFQHSVFASSNFDLLRRRRMAESTTPGPALPDCRNLTENHLTFLNENFRNSEDLEDKAPLLLSQLSAICSATETDLQLAQLKLGKFLVSGIYASVSTKHDVEKLKLDVQKLSFFTSPCDGYNYKLMQKMIREDFPRLRKEIRLVEAVRDYVGTTLRLEALVGDLEDVMFSITNQRAGNVFSFGVTRSISEVSTHERLLQAVKITHEIEEVLVTHPQWSHLLKAVDIRVDRIISTLRTKFIADHRALLISMGWPRRLLTMNAKLGENEIPALPNKLHIVPPEKREAYSNSFLCLCVLQHLQTRREQRKQKCSGQKLTCRVLWGIDELVSPIASQTEYHFSKWADQPKLIFALVFRITQDYFVEIEDVLQPLIDKARLAGCSATEGWVFAMVQMLAGFLTRIVFPPLVEKYKVGNLKQEAISAWIHLIDLMLLFDKQMMSLLSSEAGRLKGVSGGVSVLSVFVTRPEWLKLWAKMELKEARRTLKIELNNENCWLYSHDSLRTRAQPDQLLLCSWQEYNAPSVAEFAIKLGWDMIERAKNLPNIPLQAQFIRLTADRFLWYFLKVLILQGKRSELGHDALSRKCDSINAARFVESKLLEWSDEVTFVEMVCMETKIEAASADILSDKNRFFCEEMKAFAEFLTNGIMEIITNSLCQFESLSWNFIHGEHNEASRDNIGLSVSHTLIGSLDFLRDRLIMLKEKLNPSSFLDLWRSMADGLDHFILNSILETGTELSLAGAHQFDTDMKAVSLVFQPFCDRPEAFLPRISCTLQLLRTDKVKLSQLLLGSHEVECLQEYAITHLGKYQVEKIMNMMRY